jgi:glycogen operon protein
MDDEAWSNGLAKTLMVFLNGGAIPEPDPRGQQILGDSFLILFNAYHEPITFTIPGKEWGPAWIPEINTAGEMPVGQLEPDSELQVGARSTIVLRCPREPAEGATS